MKKSLPLLFCFICSLVYSKDYTGNNLLDVLGKSVYSPEFKQFSEFWLLDKKLENTLGGIKLLQGSTGNIDTILVAGHDFSLAGTDYFMCSSPLPFNLTLNDRTEDISSKLQATPVPCSKSLLFAGSNYSVLINNAEGKTRWAKFYITKEKPVVLETKAPVAPAEKKIETSTATETYTKLQANNNTATYVSNNAVGKNEELKRSIEKEVFESSFKTRPAPVATTANVSSGISTTTTAPKIVTTESGNKKNEEFKRNVEKSVFESSTAPVKSTAATTANSSISTFKKAILDVFKSYKESAFSSIKGSSRNSSNFWNYKYTYSTKLKIPGEQFNMLYSFPFPNSTLDFVSILHEGESFDATFKTMYKDFEKKLMENFPVSEGWTSSCIINKESSAFSDLEFKNDKYGAIVLDYSKSPKGRHVLYLRFLLYN